MPQPTVNDVHVDAVLTGISVAYMQNEASFVASKVFPTVNVNKQSDLFYTYSQADFWRDQVEQRADGTESAGSGYGLSTDSYSASVYALHKDVADKVRANSDNPLNADRDAANFLAQQMLIKMETDFVTNFFSAGIWTTDKTPSTLWDAASGSDPIGDIQTGLNTVRAATGYTPNTLTLAHDVLAILKNHTDIVDRFKYTSSASVTTEMLAAVLGVERVLVEGAMTNTAVEGATAAFTQLGVKDALLSYAPSTPGLQQPSAGYNFNWTGLANTGGFGTSQAVSTFRMDALKSDRIEIEAAWDLKLVSADLGYFFSNAIG
tara:strand:+ start:1780 stop:2736 length:957 start_codon:yes stop_codon:yes gene_type:complete